MNQKVRIKMKQIDNILYADEGNKVKRVHHKQLSSNILPYNEEFEGKKTGYRAKSSL